MASLAQLLVNHGGILVLDAASTRVQTGLLRAGKPAHWQAGGAEAGQQLFTGVEACLRGAGLKLADVPAFVFCEGPGSMLGIRTVAMAVRTWLAVQMRPVYRYQSLTLLAHGLRQQGVPAPFAVIADARRESWHAVTVEATGAVQPLRRAATAELAGGTIPLHHPAAFRSWAPTPRPAQDCSYDVADLLARLPEHELFTATGSPDAFQHEAPEYKKWSAEVHQAPASP